MLEPLRHVHNPGFGAVIFRRTSVQIRNEGGLWDESTKLYLPLGAEPRETTLEWRFPSGAKVSFAHLQYESDRFGWQGAQIAYLGFDELSHFTANQFFYLLSRNRTLCGVRPYVRATTNPDPLSWVKEFLAPWIAADYPEPAADGELRWFIREGGLIQWVDPFTPDAKSVTFIRASVYDNKILLDADPAYLANLKALPLVDRKRLLEGDWEFVAGGDLFRREWFPIIEEVPAGLRLVRYWDLAATETKPGKQPDWTAGVLMGSREDGRYYVLDVQRAQASPRGVEELILQTAQLDRKRPASSYEIRMEQEPGASGVNTIDHYTRRVLAGFTFRGNRSTGDKAERARPLSSMAQAGNVLLLSGYWNNDFLNELAAFPTAEVHDDQVDAASGAFQVLAVPQAGSPKVGGTRPVAQGALVGGRQRVGGLL